MSELNRDSILSAENSEMAMHLHDIKAWLSTENAWNVPNGGVFSLLARGMKFICYDHPSLNKISKSAFTDGLSLFVNADFIKDIVKEEVAANGEKVGFEPLLFQELSKVLFLVNNDLKKMDKSFINEKLQSSFPNMDWLDMIKVRGEKKSENMDVVSIKRLVKVFENSGLSNMSKQLGYPKSDDVDSLHEINKKLGRMVVSAVRESLEQRSNFGDKYPSAALVDLIKDAMVEIEQPKKYKSPRVI